METISRNYFDDKTLSNIMFKYEATRNTVVPYLENLTKDFERKYGTRTVAHLESRIKKIDRVAEKLKKKKLEINEENVYKNVHDMVGVRLVCPFLHDVYDVICLIKSSGLFIINEKDFITHPKESGYRGYHMIVEIPVKFSDYTEYVEVEIQIKTSLMHAWDTVQHNVYEKERSGKEINDIKYKLLQEMSEEFMGHDIDLDPTFKIENFDLISTMTNYDELYIQSTSNAKELAFQRGKILAKRHH